MTEHDRHPRAAVACYRELSAWQAAVRAATESHRVARTLPRDEWHGLGLQIRRAAASVPANIAEGNGRFSRADYLRFLSIANGSMNEVESHLILANRCNYLPESDLETVLRLWAQSGRLLMSLTSSLRRSR